LQGVTTLPEARRRGVAATLSSALVEDHLARAEQAVLARAEQAVWLSVQDAGARACYAGIGFAVIGGRCNDTLED
jgi:predicted GNAT family acetyltransferase